MIVVLRDGEIFFTDATKPLGSAAFSDNAAHLKWHLDFDRRNCRTVKSGTVIAILSLE